VKTTDPNRSRTVAVMIAFALLLLVAMATQYARMRAGQVPLARPAASHR
jgi:hypothetical protein